MDIKFKEDYDLVDKFIRGDEESGRTLYADVFEFLKKFIYKYTNNDVFTDEDRDDILQNTLERSILILCDYNGSSRFSTWIIGISKNIIKEKLREINRISEKEVLNEDKIDFTDIIDLYNQDPLNIIIAKEKIESYQKAFEQLPGDYKTIIKLRNHNGVSRSDVSKIMDRSVDAVDKLYFRAIKKLRENFIKIY